MDNKGSFIGVTIFATLTLAIILTILWTENKHSITGYTTLGGISSISYSPSEFQNAQSESDFTSRKNVYDILEKYASQYDTSFNLVRAIIKRESNWKHTTTPNSKGAIGIMQLKAIATEDMEKGACADFCNNLKIDRTDLEENIQGGICYLACQKQRFEVYNSPELIIAAYKEGPTSVDKKCITCWLCRKKNYDACINKLDSATVSYVTDVVNNYKSSSSGSEANQKSNYPLPNVLKVIVIDAGHGGKDPGAIGILLDYPEKTITLAIAKELKSQLEQKGIQVIMTRTSDNYPTLKQRVTLANSKKADLFISIHTNSARSKPCSANGVEVWSYDSEKGKAIAETVADGISNELNIANRGTKTSVNLYVLKKTSMTAILVEAGFICNQNDFNILISQSKQKQIAQAIADGILKSFS